MSARPAPQPRVCAHCAKPYDGTTAAQHGFDAHIINDTLVDTCSPACRAAMGLRERYRTFTRDPWATR